MGKTYSEKLKDPRWQKKRLEVLEKAGWKCEWCECDGKTLNVHHGRYEKDMEPWEYSILELHALCDECHKKRHEIEKCIKAWVAKTRSKDMLLMQAAVNGASFYEFGLSEFPHCYYDRTKTIRMITMLMPCMDVDDVGRIEPTEEAR